MCIMKIVSINDVTFCCDCIQYTPYEIRIATAYESDTLQSLRQAVWRTSWWLNLGELNKWHGGMLRVIAGMLCNGPLQKYTHVAPYWFVVRRINMSVKLKVYENRVLRRIFGLYSSDITTRHGFWCSTRDYSRLFYLERAVSNFSVLTSVPNLYFISPYIFLSSFSPYS
jgi:hypothetical protein